MSAPAVGLRVMLISCSPQKVDRTRPRSTEDLMVVLEGVRALEALVQAAEEPHRPFNDVN